MRLFYGNGNQYEDITNDAIKYCFDGNRIFIPSGDTGGLFFSDPLYGYLKNVIAVRLQNDAMTCRKYEASEEVRIYPSFAEKKLIAEILEKIHAGKSKEVQRPPELSTTDEVISFFHAQLNFRGGHINHEWREQSMIVEYLNPDAQVLELGSNIGRSTLMISCILNDPKNLVTVECNPFFVELLRNNRFANRFDFHIEEAALSYRKLMQSSDNYRFGSEAEAWEAVPSEELSPGYEWIASVTFEELQKKYQLRFDTLVADCEGALFYILQDRPEILTNIGTIITESDYRTVDQKWAVEKIFTEYGFERIHAEALVPNLTELPQECADSFWEVWRKPC